REVQAQDDEFVTSGTLMYMSPEQLTGNTVDERSDLYSLATTIYQILNGTPPFFRGSIAQQIQSKTPAPIPHCHEAVNRVLLKALQKDPADRHEDCREFFLEFARVAHRVSDVPLPAGMPPTIPSEFDSEAPTLMVRRHVRAEKAKPLGQLLVEAGVIDAGQLEAALLKHKGTPGPLGSVLIQMGAVDEAAIVKAISDQTRIPAISLEGVAIDAETAGAITGPVARYRRCIPVRREGDNIVLAMADPLDFEALNAMESACGLPVVPRIARESEILEAIRRVYGA
ncbi:MAG: protein kinase, partial [Candidatus Hydrogenedentales bacterium]